MSARGAQGDTGRTRAASLVRKAWPAALALVWVAGAIVLARAGGAGSGERRSVVLATLERPWVGERRELEYDGARRIVRATGERPHFVLRGPDEGLWAVTLRLSPVGPLAEDGFLAYRVPPGARKDESDRSHHHFVTRGTAARERGLLVVRWNFAEATSACRIELPRGAEFELHELELVSGPPEAPAGTLASVREAVRTLAGGLILWGLVLALWLVFPRARARPEAVRAAVLTGLVASFALTAVLVPPFQGPDEWRHWKAALDVWHRSEPALANLPETVGAGGPRFRSENQQDARRLLAPPEERGMPSELWQVSYDNPLTYPVVGLVSLLFPRVETTAEGLTFYYLCRAVPAGVLVALLLVACRMRLLPWTAVALVSSPLLAQQLTTVTADTLPDLGTLAALLLFAAQRSRPRPAVLAALWAVSLWVVLAKPPLYLGLLLLPLQLTPLGWLRRRRLLALLSGVLLLALALFAARAGLTSLGAAEPETNLGLRAAQLRAGEGMGEFWHAWRRLLASTAWVDELFGPLGWLDTHFTQRHLTLIRLSLWLAIALDVVVVLPGLARRMRAERRQAAVTLACIAVNVLFLHLAISAVMFLVETPLSAPLIIGVQMRYLLPCALIALLLPLATFRDPETTADLPAEGEGWARLLARSAAATLLPWLLFARQVETATTLLARYW